MLYAAFAASVLCLAVTSHAWAAVNQTGDLLWTTDLAGEHTDASVTPVVFSQPEWSGQGITFTASAAAFTGNAGSYPGAILTGLDTTTGYGVGPGGTLTPAPGMPTTNYLESAEGGSITMTPPAAESYLSFLTRSADPFNVTLYSGGTVLGALTATQLAGSASASGLPGSTSTRRAPTPSRRSCSRKRRQPPTPTGSSSCPTGTPGNP